MHITSKTHTYMNTIRPQVEHKRMSLLDQLSYTARIFIKGLKTSVNQRDLINYLRNFGNDNEFSVELTTNKNKKHRGFAFVNITSQKMYNRVIAQDHYIAGAKLEVKESGIEVTAEGATGAGTSKMDATAEETKLAEKLAATAANEAAQAADATAATEATEAIVEMAGAPRASGRKR